MDEGYAIRLDRDGDPVILGATGSSSFPTSPKAFDTTYNGGAYDIFVTKLEGTIPSRALPGGPSGQPAALASGLRASPPAGMPVESAHGGLSLAIYDVTGRLVRVTETDSSRPGLTEIGPGTLERAARGLGGGVYFFRFPAAGAKPGRFVLVK
jgi:hypothetical protein